MPYSFLIDYFTNLGSIIDAFSAGRASVRWINRQVILVKEVYYPELIMSPNFDSFTIVDGVNRSRGDIVYYQRRTIERHPYFGSIIPDLQFELPGLFKQVNILALIAQGRRVHQSLGRRVIRR
jgi:hypothetical protein